MAGGAYEFQSEFAKKHQAKGREEGRAEGRAQAVLDVLEARGLRISDEAKAASSAARTQRSSRSGFAKR